MKQLHGKTKNTISANNSSGNSSSHQHQSQLDHAHSSSNAVVENKFRCKVLPEHFTGAIPFVRVNTVLNYDWFVWMPDNINAGDTFVFIISNTDLLRAQQLRQQELSSTLTPTEQLNYNTKIVNEICKDIPVNTRPTRQQQERILQALHPYVPIISNSIIESRNGVTCPIFYQQYGPHAVTGAGNNHTKNNGTPLSNHQRKNGSTSAMSLLQQYKNEIEQVLHQLYYSVFPDMYHEICLVDRKRFICMMIGFTFTFIIGFIVAIHVQSIRMANNSGQCF